MKKILVVDDSAGWRNFHEKRLNSLNKEFELTICDFAKEAYEEIFQTNNAQIKPYDLIITDLQMESSYLPLYAGEWLIKRIQELKSCLNTKILIVSATYNIKTIAEEYNVDYLPKSTAVNNSEEYDLTVLSLLKLIN